MREHRHLLDDVIRFELHAAGSLRDGGCDGLRHVSQLQQARAVRVGHLGRRAVDVAIGARGVQVDEIAIDERALADRERAIGITVRYDCASG